MKAALLRPFVERFLEEFLEGEDGVEPDEDGDYTFRHRAAEVSVTLSDGDEPSVSVLSVLLRKIKKTPKLLEALNETNAEYQYAKLYWDEEAVVLRLDLLGESLDDAQMAMACGLVATTADDLGRTLQKRFGGETAFAEDEDDEPAKV